MKRIRNVFGKVIFLLFFLLSDAKRVSEISCPQKAHPGVIFPSYRRIKSSPNMPLVLRSAQIFC